MSLRPFTIPEILTALAPTIAESELNDVQHVSLAIRFALSCAESLPSTLDGRARSLIVTKLQEAEHWCLELVRP